MIKNRKKTAETAVLAAMTAGMLLAALSQTRALGQAYYVISVNGEEIGAVAFDAEPEALILSARREAMQNTEGYAYVNAKTETEISRKRFRRLKTPDQLRPKIAEAILKTAPGDRVQAYTITSGGYSANFENREKACEFLEQVKNHTEGGQDFSVLLEESGKEKDAKKAELLSQQQMEKREADGIACGISSVVTELSRQNEEEKYENKTGILSMEFADNVYGYENFVDRDTIADPAEQTRSVTKEKETNTIYVVEAGDCLSVIAEKFDTTVDTLVGLNDLKNADATVYLDQELTVVVPRPDISLFVTEGIVYEETYAADPQIIENNGWYNTMEVVHQEGTDGQREINAAVTYENGLEIERKNLHTEVLSEAVPAVVERGTLIPPTYRKPLSGGRFTSGYGRRWGRMHKGVDWATPVGTPVYASCGGTVSVAGAVRGYGYAVYINHPDGRQTRYGHLSKVLVSPGQSVEQGQQIALSGNTGRSTGPHVHFEILIEGSQVNPLNYMN